jgi:hypothetical protein
MRYSVCLWWVWVVTLIGCGVKNRKSLVQADEVQFTKEAIYKQDSLAFELCQIYGLDQGIRDRKLVFNDFQLTQKVDTLNFLKIVAFVEKNGYPTKELLGESNMKNECVQRAMPAVLLHAMTRWNLKNLYNRIRK